MDGSGAGSASGGGQSVGGAGGGTATCPPQGPNDVGPSDPSSLSPSGSITVTDSGTVIENVDISGEITINGASDVTIRNFRITTSGYWGIAVNGGSNILIEDGEIDGLDQIDDAIRGGGYTARRLYIHDIEGDSFKADGDNLIECNYVTAIGQGPEAHGDGVQMMGSGNITIRRNNFDLTSGSLTACIFPFGQDPVDGPVYVEENRLTGGAYIVYCHDTVEITNNVFGDDYAYGPVTNACASFTGNVWESSGDPVDY